MLIEDKTSLLIDKLFRHQQIFDDRPAIGIAQNGGTSPFRMGHHTKYVSLFITDSGDIPYRSIWV